VKYAERGYLECKQNHFRNISIGTSADTRHRTAAQTALQIYNQLKSRQREEE